MSAELDVSCARAREFWIIGGGRFGHHAADVLVQNHPAARVIVVDRQKHSWGRPAVLHIQADGPLWLIDHLEPASRVRAIIPAVPFHLAVRWLCGSVERRGGIVEYIPLPEQFIASLPNPYPGENQSIVTSLADFICPEQCNEPADYCTATGKKRGADLYRFLEQHPPDHLVPLILRSRQLHSGLGGYLPGDLFGLLERVSTQSEMNALVGTACRCHGVVNGLTIRWK